jgi:hypothetical protein
MPASIANFQVMLGASKFDAVNYCRNLTEDVWTPYTVPDSAYMSYHEDVAEDFSRFVPLDYQIGNPFTVTSTFVTVAQQQRYICNSGNGFLATPDRITDLLFQATNSFSAASEIAYLALLPFSPLNRFLFTPSLLDSPSERVLRDEYLSELEKYGRGYYGVVRDPASGLPAIDLYPMPMTAAIPIYVRYQARHLATIDGQGNALYATIPEAYKRQFARLLYCMVLEQEQERFARTAQVTAGILSSSSRPEQLARKITRIREKVYQELGATAPQVIHSV